MLLMTFAILITLTAAEPEAPARAYLPPNSGSQNTFTQGIKGSSSSFSSSSSSVGGSYSSFGGASSGFGVEVARNARPQQQVEKNAEILRLDQDADINGNFQYAYETSNGIRAAETGNGASSQGEFSYQGDDGNTYSVIFRAGEGGFEAQGAHLPVAPPTPEAILAALEKNARDEASGIFDDGKYRPTGDDGQYRADQSQGFYGRGQNNFKASTGQSSQNAQSGHSGFGNANRQGTFNQDTGYKY